MNLTREQILNMQPGRELNRLIDEEIFKRKFTEFPYGPAYYVENHGWHFGSDPYSESMDAAMEVEAIFDQDSEQRAEYAIQLHNVLGLKLHEPTTLNDVYLIAHATPGQRCKAALLAIGGEQNNE